MVAAGVHHHPSLVAGGGGGVKCESHDIWVWAVLVVAAADHSAAMLQAQPLLVVVAALPLLVAIAAAAGLLLLVAVAAVAVALVAACAAAALLAACVVLPLWQLHVAVLLLSCAGVCLPVDLAQYASPLSALHWSWSCNCMLAPP